MVDDRRNVGLPSFRKRFANTWQNSLSYILRSEGEEMSHRASSDIAQVMEVHTETNTVDIKSWQGPVYTNIPMLSDTGLIENEDEEREVYGTLDLPRKGEYVLVYFISEEEGKPYVYRTITPYMMKEWMEKEQVAVKSKDKQFTKKLFEKDKIGFFRRIFQSGVTFEIDDKGTTRFETPSGTYLEVSEEDEGNPGSVKIVTRKKLGEGNLVDQSVIEIDKTKEGTVTVSVRSGARVLLDEDADKVLVRDSRGSKIEMESTKLFAEAFGNVVELKAGKVDINGGNLEVLQ